MSDAIFEGNAKTTSIAQAKDWLRFRAKKGCRCPCCKQYVKIYKRALGSQMARWLIWLVRTWDHKFQPRMLKRVDNEAWIDIRLSPVRGGDYAKLLHWGLVQHKIDVLEKNGGRDKRDSGLWRPTFKGIDFVNGKVKMPSHVYLYDNMKIGEESALITIEQALGKRHSYKELMSAPIHVDVPGL